ncbi:hypothetical protein [Streptomyces sp. NBC_00878]|uniref:hypothetical protein n=1 Tax=Streptomyces sp. NBC_00878 TaxID=2975854 RepID=UPI002255D216|nr:hypothetical protein [Streptomyces sp. NBC_00878]MCX4905728.1 hypothetical protein [Streptomyces sp. NBC_00878]
MKSGSTALSSATGRVGHVLAENPQGADLNNKSAAAIADTRYPVLSALTQARGLLKKTDTAEADTFRSTVLVAFETATRARKGETTPALTDMTRKITAASTPPPVPDQRLDETIPAPTVMALRRLIAPGQRRGGVQTLNLNVRGNTMTCRNRRSRNTIQQGSSDEAGPTGYMVARGL